MVFWHGCTAERDLSDLVSGMALCVCVVVAVGLSALDCAVWYGAGRENSGCRMPMRCCNGARLEVRLCSADPKNLLCRLKTL